MTGEDESENHLEIAAQDQQRSPEGSPPSLATKPRQESDALDISGDNINPQIMAPIPPSPENPRANLNVSPPLGPMDMEQTKMSKLRKKDTASVRRRSNSLHHLGDVPDQKSRTSSPAAEPRGRRASHGQSPSARNSHSNNRVPSMALNSRPASSQSPSRGRLRRSWLPGGRSRSNSVDVSAQSAANAWVLTDDTKAEYNASYLKNAEKVGRPVQPGGATKWSIATDV